MAIGHRIGLVLAGFALLAAVPAAAQNYSDGYNFLKAVDKEDAATVDQLLNKSHTLIDSRDLTDGHTALHIAVRKRAYRWLSYLLGKGANPNLADKNGVTPLMLASQLGFVEAIGALAQSGAKVDETNDAGETPLITAVHQRDVPLIRVLLAAGADPNRPDNSGRSARDYAALDGAGGVALAEIERHARDKSAKKPGPAYGPTL